MAQSKPLIRHTTEISYDYSGFDKINGYHSFQDKVPGGCVLYRVRRRRGGKITYFNFALAKEMGLIPAAHPERLNAGLTQALLSTFAIQIINEYDIINGTSFPKEDIKANPYMATRYLQLQHPSRTGKTSGDGRSIWNGEWKYRGKSWDVTSCGTGATCLSPATAKSGKFFRSGDPSISYGCGYSDLVDGLEAAIFSDILRRNGVATERVLCIIEFPGNLSINVRAGQNLLRPSHFFNHLKQGHRERLKASIDFFIDRQLSNGHWKPLKPKENRYERLVTETARTFARMAAQFESEYIFCWLAWDGDNILADGGIIDYGSIRQFGLFHHEYRFDDVERWSTTITEQKAQARYIVQTFAQIADFINSGRKRNIRRFSKHPILRQFDQIFTDAKLEFLLQRIGFNAEQSSTILLRERSLVEQFAHEFWYFERQTSSKPPQRVGDGISKDAIFCLRDILRELPHMLLEHFQPVTAKEFMAVIRSEYATRKEMKLSPAKALHIEKFQECYIKILYAAARLHKEMPLKTLKNLKARSAIINRYERVTGDSICLVGSKIMRWRKQLNAVQLQQLIQAFIDDQVLLPENREIPIHRGPQVSSKAQKIVRSLMRSVKEMREGL